MRSPAAEVDVTVSMVHSLLTEQHPDLAGLELRELEAGWDNTLWRLGDELLVRLPRRAVAAWMLLPTSAMPAFVAAYGGIGDALGWRALGWATHLGLMLAAVGCDSRPTYLTAGRATLRRVAEYADLVDQLSW